MRLFSIIVGFAGLSAVAGAQDLATDRSEFTRLENCEDRDPGDLAPYLQVCEGLGGREIWLPYSEHSSAMAIGHNGIDAQFDERPQLGGLDMIIGPVIDWRLAEGENEPYAAIVRYRGMTPNYNSETGEYTGGVTTNANVLVVIALREDGPVSACHIAYIDAMQVPDANARAHALAADLAAGFRCGQDPVRYVDADNPDRD
ncbi:hypothetical protein [Hyphobacterium sp.]|jgi:hypothetical protein|uniref:hypothetical protein n=1 Tax=Hyphobacterium sp. TaxID=2004662 RepID=UPI003BAAFF00